VDAQRRVVFTPRGLPRDDGAVVRAVEVHFCAVVEPPPGLVALGTITHRSVVVTIVRTELTVDVVQQRLVFSPQQQQHHPAV